MEICGRAKNATRSSQLTDKFTILEEGVLALIKYSVLNVIASGKLSHKCKMLIRFEENIEIQEVSKGSLRFETFKCDK